MTAPDYQTLIDAATWDFIRDTEASYPPETASFSIEQQRQIYDTMCRRFHRGYPAGITAEDRHIADVPCRIYPGKNPVVIYLHGGGFVVGGLHSHDDVCAEIRANTGLTVVAVDYRLSPEHLHPAALDDALAVTRSMASLGPVLLAGDSAGGNLAAATAASLRHSGLPILGQVLIYPGLGGNRTSGSYQTHAYAPMLTRADVEFYAGIRHGGIEPPTDASVAPLQASDFADLPPTLAIAAECDPLADDCMAYTTAIRTAGGRAHAITAAGLVHGYLRARTTVPRAATSFAHICATLTAFANGEWPFGEHS